MASWQFDFHLVPRSSIERRFATVPVAITKADYECENWWSGTIDTANFEADLSKLLPKARSWDSKREMWGTEEGDRLELLRDDDRISDVFGRLDVRNLSLIFVNKLSEVARSHSMVIITEGRHILRPVVGEILGAVLRSPSYSFVKDPEAFVRNLKTANSDID